ncbi:hypothetical protein ACQKFS_03105 [Pseudomonas guineae]|uniref:hypothetical protein n=1 Tax=Pseudomonas guineae TaxID=425504 RepID=UPI003CFCB845
MTMTEQSSTSATPASITQVPVKSVVVVQERGHSYFVALDTGEIIYSTKKLPRHRVVRTVSATVGIDTKWPSEARDADELRTATAPFDRWENEQYLSGNKLLDLLDNQVSSNAVRALRYVSQNLTARNHWFGTINDLAAALPLPKRTLERSLKELTTINALKIRSQGKNWPTRISVHPWLAWRGDLLFRDAACRDWVGLRSVDFGGQ